MNHPFWLFVRRVMMLLALFFSWPVQAALTVNGDGTVTDSSTGLMWDQCPWGLSGATCASGGTWVHNWTQALGEAVTANLMNSGGGYKNHNDWRLPSRSELESIVDLSQASPAIKTSAFPNTDLANSYWSSTSLLNSPVQGWLVSFHYGQVLYDAKIVNGFVRLVRSGPSFSPFDALAPSSPLNVVAALGNASAKVSFNASVGGGAVVSGYTVRAYPVAGGAGVMQFQSAAGTDSVGTDIDAGSLSLNHTVTGLVNGTSYTFTVVAHSSEGDSLESVPSDPITPSFAVPFNPVDHYYQNILNRSPDAGGKAYWQSEAVRMSNAGVSPSEAYIAMARAFFTSPEFLARGFTDDQFVQNLYLTFFNRNADEGGLNYWKSVLASGLPRDMVMYAFMFSPEFSSFMLQNVGATYQRAEVGVVVDFYRAAFGRLPDDGGLKFWVNQFRAAQCSGNPTGSVYSTAISIADGFFGGPDYWATPHTPSQYTSDLYNAFMRRSADLQGFNYWVGQLSTGAQNYDQVRRQFIDTPEFAARVQAIASQACANPMQ